MYETGKSCATCNGLGWVRGWYDEAGNLNTSRCPACQTRALRRVADVARRHYGSHLDLDEALDALADADG